VRREVDDDEPGCWGDDGDDEARASPDTDFRAQHPALVAVGLTIAVMLGRVPLLILVLRG
jgi:hypothetical protein